MFATEFTYVNSTYRLVVDSTLAIQTAAWLDRQSVTYDRYFKHEGFCKFIFITAPEEAINKIAAKYPLFSPTPEAKKPLYEIVEKNGNAFFVKCISRSHALRLVDYLAVIDANCFITPEDIVFFALNEDGEFPPMAREVVEAYIRFDGRTYEPKSQPRPKQSWDSSNPAYNEYQEKCRLEDERKEALNNVTTPTFYFNYYNGMVATSYWIQCPSPEEAIALESDLREVLAIPYNYSMGVSETMIWFETPEEFLNYFSAPEMPRFLYQQLVGMFGSPVDYNDATPDGVDPTFLAVDDDIPADVPYFFADCYTRQSLKAKYRELSKLHHPDCGGDAETFIAIAEQYEQLIAQFS
jgi:hypothetical protein